MNWQAFVNAVADGLADEVVGNGVAGEAVFGEEGPFLFNVIGFGEGATVPAYIPSRAICVASSMLLKGGNGGFQLGFNGGIRPDAGMPLAGAGL